MLLDVLLEAIWPGTWLEIACLLLAFWLFVVVCAIGV